MTVAVHTYSGSIISRPETSCDRAAEDFYPPDFVDALSYTPVLCAKISRAGRCILPRFAGRYFDVLGFGVLLYPSNFLDGRPDSIAEASCLDHSTYLPAYWIDKAMAPQAGAVLSYNGKEIFVSDISVVRELEQCISRVSTRMHLRTGDTVAMELAGPRPLCPRPSEGRLTANYAGHNTLDINIIMNSI